jgi:hypothetical protein
MDEIYCEDCGAQFRNQCHCETMWAEINGTSEPEVKEKWRGMDGHLYEGDPKRASQAWHRDDCGCPGSSNFDPDSWY